MASLTDKVDLLFGATVHSLIDKALATQSVAVINEYIRRAEDSSEDLQDTIARNLGDMDFEQRKNAGLRETIDSLMLDVQSFITAGRDDQAAIVLKKKQQKEESLRKSDETIASMEKDLAQLQKAQGLLEIRIDELTATREDIVRAMDVAKSKNRTVKTFKDLAEVLEESGDTGFRERAERNAAYASVKLDQVLEKNRALLNAEADPEVAAELTRIKAQMAAESDANDKPADSATSTISVIVRSE